MAKKPKKKLVEIDRQYIDIEDVFDGQSLNKIINYFLALNEESEGIYTSFNTDIDRQWGNVNFTFEIIRERFETDEEFKD